MSRIILATLLLSSPVFAQEAKQADLLTSFLPLILIFAVFYFLIIRPNSKRQKEHKNLLSTIKKGDDVSTVSGIIGRVEAINENFVSIEIAPNTIIKLQRQAIASLLPKGTYKEEIK